MTDTAGTAGGGRGPRRYPRWMGIALVLSLAINLLVVAVIATAAYRFRHWDGAHARPNVFGFTRTLERDRRRELLDAARAERQQLRPFRGELRKARADVRAALEARPFDAARYHAAHAALLAAELDARRHAHAFFDTIVMKLTDDERARLARWLEKSERPRRGHWRSRSRDDRAGVDRGGDGYGYGDGRDEPSDPPAAAQPAPAQPAPATAPTAPPVSPSAPAPARQP